MSGSDSCLPEAEYGYDIVVAMTQASINATMKKYLLGLGNREFLKIREATMKKYLLGLGNREFLQISNSTPAATNTTHLSRCAGSLVLTNKSTWGP